MRWLLLALVLVLAVGYVGASHLSGGAFPTLGLPLGGERAELRKTVLSFMEDIQFKDFQRAASYHAPDKRDEVDIPYLLERLFMQKPESLDIMGYEVVFAEVDSTGVRARVKTRAKVKNLAKGDIRDQEFILFFHRETPAAPWYMELESSLRRLRGTKGKKH